MDTAKTVVSDLFRLGLTDSEIAGAVQSSQPTIWRIRTGKTKSCHDDLYRALSALRDTHKRRSGKGA